VPSERLYSKQEINEILNIKDRYRDWNQNSNNGKKKHYETAKSLLKIMSKPKYVTFFRRELENLNFVISQEQESLV
jgi:hypothetical protein